MGGRTEKTGERVAIPVAYAEGKYRGTLESKVVLDLSLIREVASNAGEGVLKEMPGAISVNSEVVPAGRKRRGKRAAGGYQRGDRGKGSRRGRDW